MCNISAVTGKVTTWNCVVRHTEHKVTIIVHIYVGKWVELCCELLVSFFIRETTVVLLYVNRELFQAFSENVSESCT